MQERDKINSGSEWGSIDSTVRPTLLVLRLEIAALRKKKNSRD